MKRSFLLPKLLSVLVVSFVFSVTAQEKTKIEKVKESIDELLETLYQAADSIEHIDQINSIYEFGSYAKLNNLIEYYENLGGPQEQVSKYKVHSKVLEDLLLTRKRNIDIGNIIDLDYQQEVKEDISEIRELLIDADAQNIYVIKRKFETLQDIFDLKMEQNTVMEEWKEATRKELEELKRAVDQKSSTIERK